MKKIFAFLLVFLLALPLSATVFAADYSDYEYYIKDYHVDAIAHTDRSFEVTETIQVYYNMEKRGIIRDILSYSSTEEYSITNVSVVGDPYEVEDGGDRISIRIGDADTYIVGDKTYTVKYTLEHYADDEPNYDYFYFNIIGDGWDVPIEHFSAEITLPEQAVINGYNITAGRYGSTGGQNYAESSVDGNVISIEGLQPLDPYEGVTINAEMLEGAFPDAAVYVTPVVVHNINITATVDEYGVVTVREDYDATINSYESFSHSLYTRDGRQYNITERKISYENWITPEGKADASYLTNFLRDYVGQRVTFSYVYEMRYRITELDKDYSFLFPYVKLDKGIFDVENRSVTVDAPFAIDSWGFANEGGYILEEGIRPVLSDDRTTISDEIGSSAEGFVVRFEDAAFKRTPTVADYIAPITAAALALLIGLFAFLIGKEKPLTPPIEFYPPDGMNPAELGYIIDHNVSGRDVTSLIYYWASKNYLTIEVTDQANNFVLHKLKELDAERPQYEKDMFEALWARGANNMVSSKNLEEKFYDTVNNTAYKVKRSFTGMRRLESNGRKALSTALAWIIAVAAVIGCAVCGSLWGFSNNAVVAGILLGIVGLIVKAATNSYRKNMYKSKVSGNTAKMVGIIILSAASVALFVALVGGRSLSVMASVVASAALMFTMISLPFLKRRTEFGTYALELTIGFKTFLETAERQRLEMLLEENPDYYYDILPYAQVLGVSGIWEKKFDGLLKQPPQWYYGAGVDSSTLMTYHMMRTMTMMTRNMTSRPAPQASSGGGFGGGGGSFGGGGGGFSGGGSFSGGGFSGGGSGGGGGRSW